MLSAKLSSAQSLLLKTLDESNLRSKRWLCCCVFNCWPPHWDWQQNYLIVSAVTLFWCSRQLPITSWREKPQLISYMQLKSCHLVTKFYYYQECIWIQS